ncbi:MAG: hypothetical protein FWD61_11615 [Phycisphaerales bacterium]|nr:hypothetical protein [Phycisphaerales bacterium]
MEAIPHSQPFDYTAASEVALAVIRANWQLANRTGLDAETLRCELAAEIWEGYEHFDPRRSSFKTFAGNIAWKRLIDRYRRRSRVTARELTWGGEGVTEWQGEGGTRYTPNQGGDEIPTILKNIFVLVPGARGRPGHPPSAYVQALAYRNEHGLGWRSLGAAIAADNDLMVTLGFVSPPSVRRLIASRRRLQQWSRRQRKKLREETKEKDTTDTFRSENADG